MIWLRGILILALALVCAPAFAQVDPIVILATGQSNFNGREPQTWTPAPNVLSWNYDGFDGHVGRAFVAPPRSSINLPEKIASDIAAANPTRQVYVITVAINSMEISHWMVGTPAPDMYANVRNNVAAALAAIGVSKIDGLFWYQGESQTASPYLYVDNFNTVMDRFKAETWFPRATPVIIYSIAPTPISGKIATDATNAALQAAVRAEPGVRRMVDTGMLGPAYWANVYHGSALGYMVMGQMGADAYLRGEAHPSTLGPLIGEPNAVKGRPAFRNLFRGGDFTTNSWRYGTSFVNVPSGTLFLQNFTYVSAGTAVVDINKTADAPTAAQAGTSTQHCLDVHVTTADEPLSVTAYYGLSATVSGPDSSFLGFGQAGAKNLVISFWVKATVPGNYFVAVENSEQNRSYNSQYAVNASDVWEKKYVVIQGDAAGTWLATAGVGLRLFWTLGSSDAYLFGRDLWHPFDVRVGNVTRANGVSSTGNHFKLALIQVEEGLYPSDVDRDHESLEPAVKAMMP